MLIAAEYPFLEIVGTMAIFFVWIMWIWTVIAVLSDVFRRQDLSGGGKAGWTLLIIFLPVLGVLLYLIGHSRGMAERNMERAQAQRAAFDDYVRKAAGSEGAAGEIAKAKELLDSGAITPAEYEAIKAKAVA